MEAGKENMRTDTHKGKSGKKDAAPTDSAGAAGKIRAVFLDVDQTLFSHRDRRVPESALQALKAVQDRGIYVFISTGRHMLELDVLPEEQFRYDGYNILNGQMCLDDQRRSFYEKLITGRDREELLTLYRSRELPVVLVGREGLYINYVNDYVRSVMKAVPAQNPEEIPFDGGDLYMGCVFFGRERDAEFAKRFSGLTLTRWHPYAADVVPAGEGKVGGIRQFLRRYGMKAEEIMAFGDEENDMGMLSFAGIGVAMGNAPDKVKAAADYVTSHIDEDGISRALDHFGLI